MSGQAVRNALVLALTTALLVVAGWAGSTVTSAAADTGHVPLAVVDRQRLYHDPIKPAMRWREADGRVALRLHTGREVEAAWAVLGPEGDRMLPMRAIGASRLYRYWEVYLEGRDRGEAPPLENECYRFAVLASGSAGFLFVGADGTGEVPAAVEPWVFSRADVPLVEVPAWVSRSVFYQIFPERFANGDPSNDPPGTVPWDARPTTNNFFGGDLQGVIDRSGYLADLGVTAIWFNPVFDSVSNHKYDTRDYRRIDPDFGDLSTFRRMMGVLHGLGIRVVLDGVFNHTGDEFWAFQDVVQRGTGSPYYDWYDIWRWPVTRQPVSYRAWAGYADMPELNHDNPEVRQYISDTVRFWMQYGVDGWRLDVANEVPYDFWREFRKLVKSVDPDAYLVGEIWQNGEPWLRGDQFDAVMNYRFRDAVLQFVALRRITPTEFDARLSQIRADYPGPIFYALLNLLGSHDTERFLTAAGGDVRRLKLAALFQMTYPGAPIVYYGDEVGLQGGRDPDNRRAFPWDPERQDRDLLAWYRTLIALRRSNPVLAVGDVRTILAVDTTGVYAYVRELTSPDNAEPSLAVVVLNNSDARASVGLVPPRATFENTAWRDALTGESFRAVNGEIEVELAPMQGRVLFPAGSPCGCREER